MRDLPADALPFALVLVVCVGPLTIVLVGLAVTRALEWLAARAWRWAR